VEVQVSEGAYEGVQDGASACRITEPWGLPPLPTNKRDKQEREKYRHNAWKTLRFLRDFSIDY
jgi:hypothetical protein